MSGHLCSILKLRCYLSETLTHSEEDTLHLTQSSPSVTDESTLYSRLLGQKQFESYSTHKAFHCMSSLFRYVNWENNFLFSICLNPASTTKYLRVHNVLVPNTVIYMLFVNICYLIFNMT